MTFFRNVLLLIPAACVLAQTPPQPAAPPPPASAPKPAGPNTPATPPPGAVQLPVKVELNPPKPANVPPDRVVLKVGDISITAEQFDQLIGILPAQQQAMVRGPARKQFADNLVNVLVLAGEAKRRKMDQTPAFKVQAEFNVNNLLAGMVYRELGKDTKVSDDAAHKYYEAHKADFEDVTARHILIRVQGSPVPLKPGQKELSDAEALAKAQELRKKIADGADFAALATSESDDAGSGANGGSLGTFHHGQMVPSFEQAAFAMTPGQVSDPVKSQFGYHIIKVEAHQTKSFEQVRADIDQRLVPEETQKAAQKALEDMVKGASPVYDPEFFNMAKQ